MKQQVKVTINRLVELLLETTKELQTMLQENKGSQTYQHKLVKIFTINQLLYQMDSRNLNYINIEIDISEIFIQEMTNMCLAGIMDLEV